MSLPYRKQRYIMYAIAIIVLFFFPFIQIDGNQIFLLSFEKGEFHLVGTKFNMQELYVMPFLVIILFIGIFFMTTMLGRFWCGWCCPQTMLRVIYRDLLQTKIFGLRRNIANKQQPMQLDGIWAKIKAVLAFLIVVVLCLTAAANLMFFFTPPYDFFQYIQNPSEHPILMGFWLGFGLFFAVDIAFIQENFCVYICPYCRIQSVLYDNDTKMAIYDERRGGAIYKNDGINIQKLDGKLKFREPEADCVECQQCVKVCPTHIDIRKGMQLECINCLECVDACTAVMGKYNKPTLVNWSSPFAIDNKQGVRYFRLKTIAYIAVLCAAFIGVLVMGSKKEGMLLNVNTTAEPYKIRSDEVVDNTFRILLHNTDKVAHEFSLEIVDGVLDSGENINEVLEIIKPKKPVLLKPGKKYMDTLTIRAHKNLSLRDDNDTIHRIMVRSFALDDKENIFAERKTQFTYPSRATIKRYFEKK